MLREGKADRARLRCPIHAVARIRKIAVIRDGKVIFERLPNTYDHAFDWTDPNVENEAHYYFMRVEQGVRQKSWGIAW